MDISTTEQRRIREQTNLCEVKHAACIISSEPPVRTAETSGCSSRPLPTANRKCSRCQFNVCAEKAFPQKNKTHPSHLSASTLRFIPTFQSCIKRKGPRNKPAISPQSIQQSAHHTHPEPAPCGLRRCSEAVVPQSVFFLILLRISHFQLSVSLRPRAKAGSDLSAYLQCSQSCFNKA